MSFADLGLSPELLRAVTEAGYTEPTPIQAQAIPVVLAGKDVMGGAQTGTGKTAGFTLPMLERLTDPVRRSEYVGLLADLTGVSEVSVGESLRRWLGGRPQEVAKTVRKATASERLEREMLRLLARDPEVFPGYAPRLTEEHFRAPSARRLKKSSHGSMAKSSASSNAALRPIQPRSHQGKSTKPMPARAGAKRASESLPPAIQKSKVCSESSTGLEGNGAAGALSPLAASHAGQALAASNVEKVGPASP